MKYMLQRYEFERCSHTGADSRAHIVYCGKHLTINLRIVPDGEVNPLAIFQKARQNFSKLINRKCFVCSKGITRTFEPCMLSGPDRFLGIECAAKQNIFPFFSSGGEDRYCLGFVEPGQIMKIAVL